MEKDNNRSVQHQMQLLSHASGECTHHAPVYFRNSWLKDHPERLPQHLVRHPHPIDDIHPMCSNAAQASCDDDECVCHRDSTDKLKHYVAQSVETEQSTNPVAWVQIHHTNHTDVDANFTKFCDVYEQYVGYPASFDDAALIIRVPIRVFLDAGIRFVIKFQSAGELVVTASSQNHAGAHIVYSSRKTAVAMNYLSVTGAVHAMRDSSYAIYKRSKTGNNASA